MLFRKIFNLPEPRRSPERISAPGSLDQNTAPKPYLKQIFIGGEGRSGTRLLRSLLGRHKNIFEIKRETYIFIDDYFKGNSELLKAEKKDKKSLLFAVLAAMFYRKDIAKRKIHDQDYDKEFFEIIDQIGYESINSRFDALDLLVTYFRDKAGTQAQRAWVEKTPQNIYYTENILGKYPEAKIIALIRDPRAVVASWIKKDLDKSLIGICLSWNKAARAIMRLGKTLGRKQFLRISYEELVCEPRITLQKICLFLEEPFDPAMLDEVSVVNTKFEDSKNRAGFDSSAVDRWRSTLSKEQIKLVDFLTRNPRKHFGYIASKMQISRLKLTLALLIESLVYLKSKFKKLLRSP